MKRFLSIFLFLLYTLTAEGIEVNRHFCCGSLAAITLQQSSQDNDCCDEKKCKGCFDDHLVIKLKTDHVQSKEADRYDTSYFIWAEVPFKPSFRLIKNIRKGKEAFPRMSSFSSSSPPYYVLHCSWLI